MYTKPSNLLIIISVAFFWFTPTAYADESKIPEPFRGDTPGSPIQIKYDDWNAILNKTVIDGGRSDRDKAGTVQANIGTRMVRGNTSSTRNEGNRLLFPAFKDDNLKILHAIRLSLEALPGQVPMREWTKSEQLAYWLNLYNITIIEQIAEEYPVRKLSKLMKGSRKHPSLWDRKTLNVADIPLSLNDIQHTILNEKWNSTIIMYGLFQGYVGSPNIMAEAFTGQNVHSLLVKNATEFVNSNRGMQVQKNSLTVSELYKVNKALFPNWKKDLKKHFLSLVDQDYKRRVNAATKISAKTKDYFIADAFGGGRNPGSSVASNAAALDDAVVHNSFGVPQKSEASMGISEFSFGQYADFTASDINLRFPEHVVDYINNMRKRKASKPGTVEVEEYEDDKSDQQ